MAKKKRKSKKTRKQKNIKTRPQKIEDSAAPVAVDVHADLRKTAILTTVCLGVLVALYLTQSRWIR